MRILEALTRLERVEQAMAEFYEWLSETFDADAEAAGLFFRLSLQERSHASLLRYGRKLVHRSPNDFEDVDFDPRPITELLAAVDEFRRSNPTPSLAEALFFAMKAECHPVENAHREVLTASNPEIGAVVRNLAIADEQHHETLQAFARERRALFDE